MHDVPVFLLIVLTNTVAVILMKQFGHANGHKRDPESLSFGNRAVKWISSSKFKKLWQLCQVRYFQDGLTFGVKI